jgi:hypothetical protein
MQLCRECALAPLATLLHALFRTVKKKTEVQFLLDC